MRDEGKMTYELGEVRRAVLRVVVAMLNMIIEVGTSSMSEFVVRGVMEENERRNESISPLESKPPSSNHFKWKERQRGLAVNNN